MSDHRPAVDPDIISPATQRRSRIDRDFARFGFAVLLFGLAAAAMVWWSLPLHLTTNLLWSGPLLVVAFLVAEQLAINVDVRSGVSWTIAFSEMPLVLGLLTMPFQVVLAAHLVAGVGTLIARGIRDKVLYNAGVMLLEMSCAYATAHFVNIALEPYNGPEWAGALLGTLTVPLVSTLIAVVAVRKLQRPMRVGSAVRLVLRVLVIGLVNTSVAVTGYELVRHVSWGWPLVTLVFAGIVALYLAYSGLLREQRDLGTLSDVSLMVASSGQSVARPAGMPVDGDEWSVIAERLKDQLSASRVVLRLWPESRTSMRTVVAGEPLPDDPRDDRRAGRDDPILQLAGASVRHFKSTDSALDIRDALLGRGAHEALVVPLRGASQLLGVLEAHDRQSRWRGFGKADVQMLGTLSSHLATAMDNRRLLGRLRYDAYHDPLTGYLNRPGFRETAGELLLAHPESVVLRIDLDVLSTVSDALGYAWGDRMVVAAGRRLREALGPDVPLARLEAGSFAVLLTGTTQEQAHVHAERLRAQLSMPYPVDRLTVEASAVVGYASTTVTDDAEERTVRSVDVLLQHADVAVRATRVGGDPVRGYMPAMGQIFLRRFQLVTQFRHAMENGHVHLHYQPKIALPSRTVIGAEALVRWRHPELGNLDPDEFVPAVEATGLVDALTTFVTDHALRKVKQWQDRGVRMSVAVNLSVRNLADQDFPEKVAELLARNGVPPKQLTYELTESGVMADPEQALPVLRRLHQLGVVLAVDDFGTGYSSLAYLRQLPVDEVKIDKSFVLGMGTDLGDLAVVKSIVELGHSLGLTVVAEGVEDDSARDALVTMGCDVAQGYLISRPLAEDRFEAWLQARTVRTETLGTESVLTLVP